MATERDNNGTRRDKAASVRDRDAQARDASAQALDTMAVERENRRSGEAPLRARRFEATTREQSALTESAAESRERAAADRDRAAHDRESAAHDRESAAHDRESAAHDRESAAKDRESAAQERKSAARDRAVATAEREESRKALAIAHLDDLTGVYRRAVGIPALQQAIDRARREKSSAVLGFVDIDGLKRVNDGTGHAAGDELIVSVANAMRSRMRSYEPIVRFGGDEFVCIMSNVDTVDVESRFAEIRAVIASDTQGTISLGLATLNATDDLESLINRADSALIASRDAPV